MVDPGRLLPRVVGEFQGLSLGDRRLDRRVVKMATALASDPTASVRRAGRTVAGSEALYRLIRNPRVSMTGVLEPHMARTAERCAAVDRVLVVHDTSGFQYRGQDREGLGRLRTSKQRGFFFHASVAVEAGTRDPMGLIASKVWIRGAEMTSIVQGKDGARKASGRDYLKAKSKESDRWAEQIQAAADRLTEAKEVVHVADREADIFSLLVALRERGHHFVIRLARDKKAREKPGDPLESIIDIARRAQGSAEIEVPITGRAPSSMPRLNKTFAARDARQAKLEFAGVSAEIRRPVYVKSPPETLPIHVVHVRELGAPDGQQSVEWLLLTSLPIDTEKDVREVVEIYRARWLIEEFFKALKTGCQMEHRELESLHTLTNVLGVCIPIAYQLLKLRHLARTAPDTPATKVLSPAQISILRAETKMPARPTAHQALVALAYLGGHYEPFHRKLPGWLALGRGLERLVSLERGWMIRDFYDAIKR